MFSHMTILYPEEVHITGSFEGLIFAVSVNTDFCRVKFSQMASD